MNEPDVVCLLDFNIHSSPDAPSLRLEFFNQHKYFQLLKRKIIEKDRFDSRDWIISAMEDVVQFFKDITQNYRKRIRKLPRFPAYIDKDIRKILSNNPEFSKTVLKKTRGKAFYLIPTTSEKVHFEMAFGCSLRKVKFLPSGCDDRNLVMKCLKLNGLNLVNASDRLQKDYKIVMAAVKQNGKSIKHVNSEILTKDLVKTALLQNPKSIIYVRNFVYNNMKDDIDIVNSIQRFLKVQHVCKPQHWARLHMFERIFLMRKDFREKYSIDYESTNKQEIRIWGEQVSNLNGLLERLKGDPRVFKEDNADFDGWDLFMED